MGFSRVTPDLKCGQNWNKKIQGVNHCDERMGNLAKVVVRFANLVCLQGRRVICYGVFGSRQTTPVCLGQPSPTRVNHLLFVDPGLCYSGRG